MPEVTVPDPDLVFAGGVDSLQLEADGTTYHPGDVLPQSVSQAKRISLQKAGVILVTRHYEPDAPVPIEPDEPEAMMATETVPVEQHASHSRRSSRKEE